MPIVSGASSICATSEAIMTAAQSGLCCEADFYFRLLTELGFDRELETDEPRDASIPRRNTVNPYLENRLKASRHRVGSTL
jgi:hypothetical protein